MNDAVIPVERRLRRPSTSLSPAASLPIAEGILPADRRGHDKRQRPEC
ncbi:hypothetical protein ACP70R_015680 [Stipagrostis hirtigluma subsp. patula]